MLGTVVHLSNQPAARLGAIGRQPARLGCYQTTACTIRVLSDDSLHDWVQSDDSLYDWAQSDDISSFTVLLDSCHMLPLHYVFIAIYIDSAGVLRPPRLKQCLNPGQETGDALPRTEGQGHPQDAMAGPGRRRQLGLRGIPGVATEGINAIDWGTRP